MDFKNVLKKLDFSHNSYLIIIILVGVAFMLFPSDNKKTNDKNTIEKPAISINNKE